MDILAFFFAGALIANSIPHIVQGVSGNPFPTPFASPRGVGNSSPVVNVLWGFVNVAAGAGLMSYAEHGGSARPALWIAAFVGALVLAIPLAWHFGTVRRDNSQR